MMILRRSKLILSSKVFLYNDKGINWNELRKQPGLIVPRMVLPEGLEKKTMDHEKIQQFLKTLESNE